MINTYFKHKNLYKYTKVAGGQDRMKVMRIIDLVLVKRDMLQIIMFYCAILC